MSFPIFNSKKILIRFHKKHTPLQAKHAPLQKKQKQNPHQQINNQLI